MVTVFWVSFINSIKRHVRSVTPFIMQVLSTLVIIIILGSALSGSFKAQDFISPVKVALVNESKGSMTKEFVSFLNSMDMEKLIKISNVDNIETAKTDLKHNKYDGVIEIKDSYSEIDSSGISNGIETYIINNDKTTFQVLSSIINGWKNNSSAIHTALMSGQSMDSISAALERSDKTVMEIPLSKKGSLPKAMDYYTITMAIMTLIFSGYNTLGRLQEDFLSNMRSRLQSSPAAIGYILLGDLLGVTLMSFIQMVFVLMFAHFVYGANLGTNYLIVFGTLFLMTLFGQMLAGALALGMKNADAAQGLIGTLALGLAFLSGGFYTSPIKGAAGKFLATYGTPNSLAQTAIFGSIYGGDSTIIFTCMGILALSTFILMALTIGFAKRRILA